MARTCTLEELREHAGDIINEVQNTKSPVYVSLDGWAPVMIVDADQYLNQQQAYRELERIMVAMVPGVPLPQVDREPQSTAKVDNHTVNLHEKDTNPLYPTTTEARRDSVFYENLADNGDPIEPATERLEDQENPLL